MKGVIDQKLKSVRKRTTETTTLEDNIPATASKPTGSKNTEDIDKDNSTDLICLHSIERMDREVLRFKNALDNMWLKNSDFIFTKENP